MQVSGDGLESGGEQQRMNIYARETVPANTVIAVSLSGTAPPLPAEGSESGGGQGGRDESSAAPTANVQSIPGRLDVLKWPLIAGFVVVFALGAMILARKPVVAGAGGAPVASGAGPSPAHSP